MKRRNREINIFSLSALDLFCGAMGAFILLALIALPYYQKGQPLRSQISEMRERVAELTAANEQAQQALAETLDALAKAQQALQEAQRSANSLQARLSKSFLVVLIAWEAKVDMDLYVRTPRNNIYWFKQHNRLGSSPRAYPGESAELSLDMTSGGAEVWQMLTAEPGTYEISLHNYEPTSPPAEVKCLVLYRDGSHQFSVTLPHLSNIKPVLNVIVDAEGNVRVQNR